MWSTILNETVSTGDHLDEIYIDCISTKTREIKSVLEKSHYVLCLEIVLKLQGFKGYGSNQNKDDKTSEIKDIFDAHYLVIEKRMTELVDYLQQQMQQKVSLHHKYYDGIREIGRQDTLDDDDDCIIISPPEIAMSSIPLLEIIPETVINQEIQSMESDDNSLESQYKSSSPNTSIILSCDGISTETHELSAPSMPILEHGPEIATNQEVQSMESGIDSNDSSQCDQEVLVQSEHQNDCNRSNMVDLKMPYEPGETLKCVECNQLFQKHTKFINHMDAEHDIKKPYRCSDCTKCFKTKGNLCKHIKRDHTAIHSEERPFRCSQCDSSFKVKGDLTKHIRFVHQKEKRFHCDRCSKGFFWKKDLIQHLRVHTGEKPFQCTICGKAFSTKGALTRHKRLHTGEKPYECSKCHMAFTQSGSRRKHEKKCAH